MSHVLQFFNCTHNEMTHINMVTCLLLMTWTSCGMVYVLFSIVLNACNIRNWPEVCPEICLLVVLVFFAIICWWFGVWSRQTKVCVGLHQLQFKSLSLIIVYFKELEFLYTFQTVNVFRIGSLVHVLVAITWDQNCGSVVTIGDQKILWLLPYTRPIDQYF